MPTSRPEILRQVIARYERLAEDASPELAAGYAPEVAVDGSAALRFAAGLGPAGDGRRTIEIHHVVLKRLDGSELRRDFAGASIETPRVGSAIQLRISELGAARVRARVTAVEILSVVPGGGGHHRPTELTVHAQELMYVPVPENDP